jgi:anti-anti-sigma regulatory factor
MLDIHVDNVGDAAVVECEGRIVRSDAAFELRNTVTSQLDARVIVLDLSRVSAIEGGGLGMLWYLQRWARDHDIRLKVFNPSRTVREKLATLSLTPEFEIACLDEILALLAVHANTVPTDNNYSYPQAA